MFVVISAQQRTKNTSGTLDFFRQMRRVQQTKRAHSRMQRRRASRFGKFPAGSKTRAKNERAAIELT
jgi:hypothetical protein